MHPQGNLAIKERDPGIQAQSNPLEHLRAAAQSLGDLMSKRHFCIVTLNMGTALRGRLASGWPDIPGEVINKSKDKLPSKQPSRPQIYQRNDAFGPHIPTGYRHENPKKPRGWTSLSSNISLASVNISITIRLAGGNIRTTTRMSVLQSVGSGRITR
jgi:hypothetical protein